MKLRMKIVCYNDDSFLAQFIENVKKNKQKQTKQNKKRKKNNHHFFPFLDATTHLYKRSSPSVRPYVPCYFRTTNVAISEDNKAGYTAQDAPSMRTFNLRK